MSPRQGWFFREFVATLRYELDRQDMPSQVPMDRFLDPVPGRVYVLVSPREYVGLEGDHALPDDEILKRTIFLSADGPEVVADDDHLELLRRAGAVFDINPRTVAALRRLGVAARHLRPGYSQLRDHFGQGVERPLDVMFFGSHSLRRTERLGRCARVLARHNCHLQVAEDASLSTADSPSFLAEAKWLLLKQTRVLLNLHRGEGPDLEWPRVLDAIHCGAVVVSEPSIGISPLVAGEHLLVATPESLPFVLESALSDETRLERIRTQAYERVRSWLPFALPVSVFRAAVVELVGRPASSGASLGTRVPASVPSPDGNHGAEPVPDGLAEVSLEVVELRREIARLEQIVRAGAGASSPITLIHDTPAWEARRAAEITVLLAVSGHAATIRPALDSLARSWPREFEVVIVDDASADNSRELVLDWLRMHRDISARLLAHPVSLGVGAARNTALQFARRSRYCLILDGDNEVYPRCMDALAWTLEGIEDATFAYPILEVRGATDEFLAAGGDHLLDFFGWEPDRLRMSQRVGALAMIRTERLQQLGGFTTDASLAGWEDYDLWRRVNERGWRGHLVPQILGRYRVSPHAVSRADRERSVAPTAENRLAPRPASGTLAAS